MVQFPELTNKVSEAYKAGYKTITEIGKERIRRIINKLEEEKKDNEDLGFKVFKLSESNFRTPDLWRINI